MIFRSSAFLPLVLLLSAAARLGAMNAAPDPVDLLQPDGTAIRLSVKGSPFHHWLEDDKGYTVVRNDAREYVYATLGDDGRLAPTAFRVDRANPAAVGVPRGLARTAAPGRAPADDGAPAPGFTPPDPVPASGTVKNLVVLCKFADHTLGTHTRPEADYDTLFNAVGGDPSVAPTGSVRDYFTETSYGVMTLDSTVTAWVTLPHDESYYADGKDGTDGAYPKNAQGMVEDALDLVDALVDFGDFDQDNDGYIDAISIVHSGYGAETGGGGGNWIWSHRWTLWALPGGRWTSADNNGNGVKVKVFNYHTEPALWGTSGTNIVRIGVICHETGHFFGLPDLYDTDYSSEGIGSWCLMANSWGFDGTQRHPPHPSAWCKVQLGWVTPTVVASGNQSLPRVEDNPAILKITQGFPTGEYLLIENRQPVGIESVIPQGGLAIWHIDELKSGNTDEGYPGQSGWPGNARHYKVALLQADGLYDLENDRDRGDSGDLYRSGGNSAITAATVPGTDAYREGSAGPTGNTITNIGLSSSTMSFAVNSGTGQPVITSPSYATGVPGSPFSYQITATGNPTSFTASPLPAGLALNSTSGLISGVPSTAGITTVYLSAGNLIGTGTATLTVGISAPLSLEEAFDGISLAWTSGGQDTWSPQTAITQDGSDAGASGDLGDSQSSWVQTSVTGPGTLSFWWKVSSEANYDFLRFTLDGAEPASVPPVSGEVDWTFESISIPSGSHTLRWHYTKDFSISRNDDTGWLDQVIFSGGVGSPVITSPSTDTGVVGHYFSYTIEATNSPTNYGATPLPAGFSFNPTSGILGGTPGAAGTYVINLSAANGTGTGTGTLTLDVSATSTTLTEALDATELSWTTGGTSNWLPETTTTHDGSDAAGSGAITHDQQSWLQTTVTGPGTLDYWWRVSSEVGYDLLSFRIDGAPVAGVGDLSGEPGWQHVTLTVPAGTHALRWTYAKDYSVSSGSDAAWVDQVSYTGENQVTVFASSGGVTVPDAASAPPSTIVVSGVTSSVLGIQVELHGLSHDSPGDLDAYLVAPNGQVCALMSDAGGSAPVTGIDLTFDDTAASPIPESGPLTTGTWRPADYGEAEGLPPGAAGPTGTSLEALTEGGVNGFWRLHLADDQAGGSGSIDSWSITLETGGIPLTDLVLPAMAEQSAQLNTPVHSSARTIQSVYDSTLLAAITPGSPIRELAFRLNSGWPAWPTSAVTWSSYEITLSRSLNPPGSLSDIYVNNIDSDAVVVRSGPLTFDPGTFPSGTTPNEFGVRIPFTTPYVYEGGHLLVTIRHTGNGGSYAFLDAAPDQGNVVQGLYSTGTGAESASVADGGGQSPVMLLGYEDELSPFQTWRYAYFNTTANTGDAANGFDFDHDGYDNLMEYAFQMNPLVADLSPVEPAGHSGLPSGEFADDGGSMNFRLRYVRRTDDPDLSYQAYFGNDPDATEPATRLPSVVGWDAATETVEVWDHAPSPTRRFGRVDVNYSGGD